VALETDEYTELVWGRRQLQADKELLREDVERLHGQIAELKAAAKEKDLLIAKLVERAPQQAAIPTREMIAKRIGVPESMLDQIDLAALGIQLQVGKQ
jgi:hypothetical protein